MVLSRYGKAQGKCKVYSKEEFEMKGLKRHAIVITSNYDTLYLSANRHRGSGVHGYSFTGIYQEIVAGEIRFQTFIAEGKFHGGYKISTDNFITTGEYFWGKMISYKKVSLKGEVIEDLKSSSLKVSLFKEK